MPSEQKESFRLKKPSQSDDILSEYEQHCEFHGMAHEIEFNRVSSINNGFAITIKILLLIASSLQIPALLPEDTDGFNIYSAGAFATTFFSGILTIIRDRQNYNTLAEQHNASFLSYFEMAREIAFYRVGEHPLDATNQFILSIEHKLTVALKIAPNLSASVVSKTNKQTKNATEVGNFRSRALIRHASSMGNRVNVKVLNGMSLIDLKRIIRDAPSEPSSRNNVDNTKSKSEEFKTSNATRKSFSIDMDRPTKITNSSAMSRMRLQNIQSTLNDASKQQLIESILVDCSITDLDINAFLKRQATNNTSVTFSSPQLTDAQLVKLATPIQGTRRVDDVSLHADI